LDGREVERERGIHYEVGRALNLRHGLAYRFDIRPAAYDDGKCFRIIAGHSVKRDREVYGGPDKVENNKLKLPSGLRAASRRLEEWEEAEGK
jgi:hypothetical protein